MPLTFLQHLKTSENLSFFMFSGGIEIDKWHGMAEECVWRINKWGKDKLPNETWPQQDQILYHCISAVSAFHSS